MNIVSVRENPALCDRAIAYFQEKWASEDSRMVYEDCIRASLSSDSLLPEWYLLTEGDEIIGCAGMISNDFISRMDLCPWLCALYIEEAHRGHEYGSLLIERIRADAAAKGYPKLYLCSDHTGYYEKYGFTRIAEGFHPWGETSGVFECDTGILNPRVCFYAGSFDPPTVGHIDLIERASRLFERVVVAVMQNPAKTGLFTPSERVELLKECTRHLPNVTALCDGGLTVDAAKRAGAGVLLRGVRGESDVALEETLAAGNRHIAGLETLVMFTDPRYGFISSSVVRDVLKHNGPLEGMVPPAILPTVYARRGASR